ncbi:MAG: hypothetical protein ACE5JS_12120 [Nitrospinota bacterium]
MKHTIIAFLLFSVLTTGCHSVTKSNPHDDESLSAIKQHKTMIHYSKSDLAKIYNELTKTSFIDTPKKSKLIFKDMKVFGYASPFSLNLFININKLNKYQWPKEAVIGLFAHELSHMVSYERRSFFSRMLFVRYYPFSVATKQRVEHEADRIAIERGYGSELVQSRIYGFRSYDKKRVEKMKKVYYWPETLEKIISKKE